MSTPTSEKTLTDIAREKRDECYAKLAVAITEQGRTIELKARQNTWASLPIVVIDGEPISAQFNYTGYSHGSLPYAGSRGLGYYSPTTLPPLRFVIQNRGSYGGGVRQFPEPKKGFDYAKLAAAVIEARDLKVADRASREHSAIRKKDAEAEAAGLYVTYGKPKGARIIARPDYDPAHEPPQHRFTVETSWDGDALHVHMILTVLRDAGVLGMGPIPIDSTTSEDA